ncbi:MAG: 6-phosphogluconolactonase [bacterium]
MTFRVFEDADALGRALAAEIVKGIDAANDEGRAYLLGCPGGRSPRSTYRALAELVWERGTDLSSVVIVMMDDYVADSGGSLHRVDPSLHCSVERFAPVEIVGPLTEAAATGRGITADRVWIPDPATPSAYDDRLTAAGGIDLFILASGDTDGHIAFNPPGSPVDSRTRVIELADSTRRDNLGTFPDFAGLDDVPRLGISVGVATIVDQSRRAVLVAPGASKQEAVRRILGARDYDPEWPATLLARCRAPSLYADLSSAPSVEEAHLPAWATTERNEVHT